jgi:methylenetetrahydrofolate dehydrogenase (NADP+)/methenyltetrahydrofolate cyclohydrolase
VEKKFEETASPKTLRKEILKLSEDPLVHGILVFSPLPKALTADTFPIFDALDPKKDVEGRTFMKNYLGVFSPTANAVQELLLSIPNYPLKGMEAVVVGNSDVVGKPVAVNLIDQGMTVTLCNIFTKDLASHVKHADIVIASAGKPHLIKGDWIKKGAVVIDVGENLYHGKLVGDVEFEAAKEKAYAISPVPGGVGPVTNVMLIKSLLRLYHLQKERLANH